MLLANIWMFFLWNIGGGPAAIPEKGENKKDETKTDGSAAVAAAPVHPLLLALSRHFVVSEANLAEGRLHTLLSYAFFHESSSHLFSNLIPFLLLARGTIQALGPRQFALMYLTGAVAGGVAYLGGNKITNKASGTITE